MSISYQTTILWISLTKWKIKLWNFKLKKKKKNLRAGISPWQLGGESDHGEREIFLQCRYNRSHYSALETGKISATVNWGAVVGQRIEQLDKRKGMNLRDKQNPNDFVVGGETAIRGIRVNLLILGDSCVTILLYQLKTCYIRRHSQYNYYFSSIIDKIICLEL